MTPKDVMDFFGWTQKDLSVRLKVTPSAVSQWKMIGAMPAARAIQLEEITGGVVRAVQIQTVW